MKSGIFAIATAAAYEKVWANLGATESLPPAILNFYGAMQGDEASTALQFIHDDAYWAHTGLATAIGKEKIGDLFKNEGVRSVITETTIVQHVATEGDVSSGASSYVITRRGGSDYHKRDAFVLVGGKIKMVWTTNGNDADPTTKDGQPWFDANQILVPGGNADADAVKVVQTAIEVYFNGFVGHNASAMQSAYHEENPLFMADFKPERRSPVACSASDDCGTYPYVNSFDDLLPAFEAFVTQPSHIQLNREFTPAGVYGDFAFVSTVSYGCEGNLVTPEGDTPAPNRELFVATRTDADGWKIRFYMFSIDPDSPITPPVEICDLNHDTPGSVWPPKEVLV
jgi:ketosteroid isomerase-like protein